MITLYMAAHKDAERREDRTIIGAGLHKPIANADLYDDTGDNISEKNARYCELTALYWIWKNDNSDFAGLEHYRRLFCNKNIFTFSPITKKQALDIFEKSDIILPERHKFSKSVYRQYEKRHVIGDLDECGRIIAEKYPDYLPDFKRVMDGKYCSLYNMFAAKKEIIDSYCGWLFDILGEFESRVDVSERDSYQQRACGFLAERLFNVWIEHNKPKIKYVKVYSPGDIPLLTDLKTFFGNIIKTVL